MSPSRIHSVTIACAVFVGLMPACVASSKKAPPAPEITSVPARDTHDKEKVTIAAEPFETRNKADFFRLDYPGHSLLPVRLLIRNDSDAPLDLNDVRIQFIAADGSKLPAATPDEMNRRLFRFKDLQPKHVPGTPISYHSTPVDKKILDDDKDFGFSQTTIAPHTTVSGFLFYDVKELDDPLLKHAEIYVKQVHAGDSKHTEVFAFTLPFDKYLASQKPAHSKPAGRSLGGDAKTGDEKTGDAKKDDTKQSEPMQIDTSHLAAQCTPATTRGAGSNW